jgi:hypothetical protein
VVKKQVPDQLPDCVERQRVRERELVEIEVERSRVGCRERAGLEREREVSRERFGKAGGRGGWRV